MPVMQHMKSKCLIYTVVGLLLAYTGDPQGTIYLTEIQNRARGTKDHKWVALNRGNLYLSMVIHLPPPIPHTQHVPVRHSQNTSIFLIDYWKTVYLYMWRTLFAGVFLYKIVYTQSHYNITYFFPDLFWEIWFGGGWSLSLNMHTTRDVNPRSLFKMAKWCLGQRS